MIADKTKNQHYYTSNKNFTGLGNAYAKITLLKISEVQVAADMDTEIDLRYDHIHRSNINPDVILIRLTKGRKITYHRRTTSKPDRRGDTYYSNSHLTENRILSAYQNYTEYKAVV